MFCWKNPDIASNVNLRITRVKGLLVTSRSSLDSQKRKWEVESGSGEVDLVPKSSLGLMQVTSKSSISSNSLPIKISLSHSFLTELVSFGQVLNETCRIWAHGQEVDQRCFVVTLFPSFLQIENNVLSVVGSHRLGDVLTRLRHGSVGTPRPNYLN